MTQPQSSSPLSTPSHSALHRQHFDVRMFQVTGDGTTDDTANIQAAVDAMSAGDTLFFPAPAVEYKITADIVVDKACTIYGHKSLIHQTTAAQNGFTIQASNVHIHDLHMKGSGYATFSFPESAFYAVAPSWNARYSNVTIKDCVWESWGNAGIWMEYLEDFEFSGNRGTNCAYLHINVTSGLDGVISDNRVKGVGPGSQTNAYGISLSRNRTASLVTDPLTTDVIIADNIVQDIDYWEGIDSHGGINITIQGNTLRNCFHGIAVVADGPASDNPLWGTKNLSVIGNTIISDVSDGSYGNGIEIQGAGSGVGTTIDPVTGRVEGNIIQGYGADPVAGFRGGLAAVYTEGLAVNNNTFTECAAPGVQMYHDNSGFSIVGNTFTDPWISSGDAPAIYITDDYNSGYVGGNVALTGSLSKPVVLSHFLKIDDASNQDVSIGPNRSEATTYIADTGLRGTIVQPPVDDSAQGNTLGTVIAKREVFDQFGLSLGFLPFYSGITYTPYAGVSGLTAWYDARAIPGTNNVAQGTWKDLTLNGYDLTQTSASLKPIYIASAINGHPALRFDGSNDYLDNSEAGLAAIFTGNDASTTIFMVVSFIGEIATDYMFAASGVPGLYGLFRTASNDRITALRRDDASALVTGTHTTGVSLTTPTLVTVRGNGTSYDIGIATAVQTFAIDVATLTASRVNVGGSVAVGSYASVDIGEILIYNSSLSNGDRTTVETQLTADWGL